ncbi:MAG: hypothetical protein KatS3mg090_0925 [Patescibacteria group bacterium]|nr:MAG: hypothetical protein KatS3mg090_0925 [Patescibacteria group bacterium]
MHRLKQKKVSNYKKHDDCEEIFFILEGGGKFKIENKEFAVGQNDCIIVEKGGVL